MSTRISGVFPALTTPFVNGELSTSNLRSNVEKFNKTGLTGYVVLGSTGESVLMDTNEKLEAVEAVKESANAGMPIIAGTGAQSARMTIDFTNKAASAGADYALIVTPFYYKGQMTAKNLELYYREVADNVDIPVIMYSVPKFTGIDMPVDAVKALAVHPNIVGLKESSGNLSLLAEIRKSVPDDFTILQGAGSVLYGSLVYGAQGGIVALGNLAPVEIAAIFKLFSEGKLDEAKEIQFKISTVNQKIVGSYGVPGIKYAVDLLGYFGGDPRPPLQPVSEDIKNTIKTLLTEAQLL
ncbi:dihydrodipicolinate synthase family protein [candidate division KSB1 bacterium]